MQIYSKYIDNFVLHLCNSVGRDKAIIYIMLQ